MGLTCEGCGEQFTLKRSLEIHWKNRKFMSCDECGDIYCNLPSLKHHKFKIHAEARMEKERMDAKNAENFKRLGSCSEPK